MSRVSPVQKLVSRAVSNGLEAFAEALTISGIDVNKVEVSLPIDEWQHLANVVESERGKPLAGDIGKINIGGVRYLARFGRSP